MTDFNSNFKNTYLNSSDTKNIFSTFSECVSASDTKILSPLVGSIFTRYGNRPPYPFTIFDSIYESNDSLPFDIDSCNNLSLPKLPYSDVTFTIEKYLSALRNSILTDRKNKVVFLSSGWDSTCILALLVEEYGPENITCITLRMAYDARDTKSSFNPYEIRNASAFLIFIT